MFFILSKLFFFILLPLTWFFLLLLLSVFSKKSKNKKQLIVSAVLVMLLFSNKFVLQQVVKLWEMPITKEESLQPMYEYGIVLGGMSHYFIDEHRLVFGSSSDRLWQAYRLYKMGRIKKLVITSGSGYVFSKEMKEALFIKEYLLSIGVPKTDLLVESESRNTLENATNTAKLFPVVKQHKVLLITSASHMRRASACFKKAGYRFDTYTTDTQRFDVIGLEGYLVPNSEALTIWGVLIKEMVGYSAYKIAGYI
jgi:uncharacterized SAM-binding protein YcdF (DUF218 family)